LSADWFRRLQISNVNWRNLGDPIDLLPLLLAIAGAITWVILAVRFGPRLWAWWKMRRRVRMLLTAHGNPSDATILYEKMLGVLKRRGIQKPAWVTPCEFAMMIPGTDTRRIVEDITQEYNALRFGGKGEAAPRIVSLLDLLERTAEP